MNNGTPHPAEIGRRRPAHWAYHERNNQSVLVMVTVCTQNRRPVLAKADAVETILSAWDAAQKWLVGRYVILPEHAHFFCTPCGPDAPPLKTWMQFWRSLAARRWPRPSERPFWQRDFWDTQLRRGESYSAKWEYVRANPVRHGLVANADDWPWQGERNVLAWHDP